jgi:ferredoxin
MRRLWARALGSMPTPARANGISMLRQPSRPGGLASRPPASMGGVGGMGGGAPLQRHFSAAAAAARQRPKKELELLAWLQGDKCPVRDMDEAVAEGVVAAIKNSAGLPVAVSSARMLGKAGLSALADTVAQERLRRAGKQKVRITVDVPHERHRFEVDGYAGESVQDLVDTSEDLARYFECACGGNAACSTCHVIVDEASFARLAPATHAEEDMLDHAYGLRPTSRLGCQLTLAPEVEGMVLTVPDGVNNMF